MRATRTDAYLEYIGKLLDLEDWDKARLELDRLPTEYLNTTQEELYRELSRRCDEG